MFEWIKKGLPQSDQLPGQLGSIKEEIERQVKVIIQGILSKMDLVTRDELDVQLNVLLRTREKLELLEARLSSLEAQNLHATTSSDSHHVPDSTTTSLPQDNATPNPL
jgi:ubiquinone biosynthesis accessory factor UbiK